MDGGRSVFFFLYTVDVTEMRDVDTVRTWVWRVYPDHTRLQLSLTLCLWSWYYRFRTCSLAARDPTVSDSKRRLYRWDPPVALTTHTTRDTKAHDTRHQSHPDKTELTHESLNVDNEEDQGCIQSFNNETFLQSGQIIHESVGFVCSYLLFQVRHGGKNGDDRRCVHVPHVRKTRNWYEECELPECPPNDVSIVLRRRRSAEWINDSVADNQHLYLNVKNKAVDWHDRNGLLGHNVRRYELSRRACVPWNPSYWRVNHTPTSS